MSRPIYEPSLTRADAQLGYGSRQLFRRPPPVRTVATLHIKVFPDENLGMGFMVETGDGKFIFAISEDMDGLSLTNVEGFVTAIYASGDTQVQLYNITQAVDMLIDVIQIDAAELNSGTSASPAVLDTTNNTVYWMDQISVDVDLADADAWGLGVNLQFTVQ